MFPSKFFLLLFVNVAVHIRCTGDAAAAAAAVAAAHMDFADNDAEGRHPSYEEEYDDDQEVEEESGGDEVAVSTTTTMATDASTSASYDDTTMDIGSLGIVSTSPAINMKIPLLTLNIGIAVLLVMVILIISMIVLNRGRSGNSTRNRPEAAELYLTNINYVELDNLVSAREREEEAVTLEEVVVINPAIN